MTVTIMVTVATNTTNNIEEGRGRGVKGERESKTYESKGVPLTNVLACCSFDLRFQYFLSGADSTSSDATLFIDAHTSDLRVPLGRYYLADAGFAACDSLITPH
jgi:hypothetical protein